MSWIQPRPGEHFSWSEFTHVRSGWTVSPDAKQQQAIVWLCESVLDPLRKRLGQPVKISRGGGFRSLAYNRLIGGSRGSHHTLGEAADISSAGVEAKLIVRHMVALALPYDQAISYAPNAGGHVHLSHTRRRENRGEILHCWKQDGRKHYRGWVP